MTERIKPGMTERIKPGITERIKPGMTERIKPGITGHTVIPDLIGDLQKFFDILKTRRKKCESSHSICFENRNSYICENGCYETDSETYFTDCCIM
jgi:hypothetical protein